MIPRTFLLIVAYELVLTSLETCRFELEKHSLKALSSWIGTGLLTGIAFGPGICNVCCLIPNANEANGPVLCINHETLTFESLTGSVLPVPGASTMNKLVCISVCYLLVRAHALIISSCFPTCLCFYFNIFDLKACAISAFVTPEAKRAQGSQQLFQQTVRF